MKRTSPCLSAAERGAGFTLLELVMAMLLLMMLVGMVFGIARTSLTLGNAVVDKQSDEMARQALFEFLGRRFSTLPGNAVLDLKVTDNGSRRLSELTFQSVPMSFTWGGTEQVAKAVKLVTVPRRNGYIDIVLQYFQDEILPTTGTQASLVQEAPFAEIVLVENVAYFEWRLLDGSSLQWSDDWQQVGHLPLQLELKAAFGTDSEEMRQIFWIPPKVDPTTMMQQLTMPGGGQGVGGTPTNRTGNINLTPTPITPPSSRGGH